VAWITGKSHTFWTYNDVYLVLKSLLRPARVAGITATLDLSWTSGVVKPNRQLGRAPLTPGTRQSRISRADALRQPRVIGHGSLLRKPAGQSVGIFTIAN
jgi:hypothetical protein